MIPTVYLIYCTWPGNRSHVSVGLFYLSFALVTDWFVWSWWSIVTENTAAVRGVSVCVLPTILLFCPAFCQSVCFNQESQYRTFYCALFSMSPASHWENVPSHNEVKRDGSSDWLWSCRGVRVVSVSTHTSAATAVNNEQIHLK